MSTKVTGLSGIRDMPEKTTGNALQQPGSGDDADGPPAPSASTQQARGSWTLTHRRTDT